MLIIDKESKETLYEQIYRQLREQIILGTIPENSMLPSTRNLAKRLQVSRNTVESAYQQLYSEGYITSRAGSGYKVERIDSSLLRHSTKSENSLKYHQIQDIHDSEVSRKMNGYDIPHEINEQGICHKERIAFQYGRLRFSDFPSRIFRKLLNQILLSSDIDLISSYNNRNGELELRIEIMKYLYESRGVKCAPEQVILCSGIPYCISLIGQLFMGYTTNIALEEPCYDTVRTVFLNHGFHIDPVIVEKEGINLDRLSSSSARAVYVTPSHQFPMGGAMPVSKRLELIEWAVNNDAYIIEDDYDSELRYNSRPIPSLQSLDGNGRVIYINTFSKSFAPGLRLSFLVLPPELLKEYQLRFNRYNCPVPLLEQKLMYLFMKEGHWSRHLRKICASNKRRHDTLVNTINDVFGDRVVIHGKNAGLHILLEVRNSLTERELIEKADTVGVTVYPVSCYYADLKNYASDKVLIGFGSLEEEEIVEGIHLLKGAWFCDIITDKD